MTTKPILLSTAYCPPVAYMSLMVDARVVAIDLHETYAKQTWRNRCRIMTANGLLDLSIPVSKPHGNHTKTKDILVSQHLPWQRLHWKTIVSAYKKSPYFQFYESSLEPLFMDTHTGTLMTWNKRLLETITHELNLHISIQETHAYEAEPVTYTDLRNSISPKNDWPGSQKKWPPYHQVFADRHGFQPDLSILDLLFNKGPDTESYLLTCAAAIANTFNSMWDRQP